MIFRFKETQYIKAPEKGVFILTKIGFRSIITSQHGADVHRRHCVMAQNLKPPRISVLQVAHRTLKTLTGNRAVTWKPITNCLQSWHLAAKGFAVLWTLRRDADGNPTHDQPVFLENPGVTIIVRRGDTIGLIREWRATGHRIVKNRSNYIEALRAQNLWQQLAHSLGRYEWQAPRGIAPACTEESVSQSQEEYILGLAALEALEEAGLTIAHARLVSGEFNTNTSWFAHTHQVVLADVKSVAANRPDAEEDIQGGIEFFTMAEIREMIRQGEFTCGTTMAALFMCGFRI